MVRAAAKNHASVTVVVDPNDYRELLDELAANQGAPTRHAPESSPRRHSRIPRSTMPWCPRISRAPSAERRPTFPDDLNLSFRKHLDLRYGENPHQQAAFYTDPRAIGASVTQARQIQGKRAVFQQHRRQPTRRWNACGNSTMPACVIVKHANPCGAARCAQHRRGLCAGLPHRPDLRFRRHHRLQSRIGCCDGAGDHRAAVRRGDPGARLSRDDARTLLAAKDNVRVLVIGDLVAAGHAAARIQERGRRPAGADARSRRGARSGAARRHQASAHPGGAR